MICVAQVWDEKDAKAERELERQQRQAQEAAKQAALQAQVHSASAAIHQCIATHAAPAQPEKGKCPAQKHVAAAFSGAVIMDWVFWAYGGLPGRRQRSTNLKRRACTPGRGEAASSAAACRRGGGR